MKQVILITDASSGIVGGLNYSLRMELKQFRIDVVIIKPLVLFTEWNIIHCEYFLSSL